VKSKIVKLIVAAVLIVTLAAMGCAPKAEPAPAPTAVPTAAPTKAPTPAPAEEVITWQYQDNMPAGNIYYEYRTDLFNRIKEASGGRLIIKQYGSGEIVPYGELAKGLRDGLLDASGTSGSAMQGLVGSVGGLFGGSGFLAGPSAVEYMGWFWMGDGFKYANEILGEDYGFHVVGYSPFSPEIWHSHKKIETADDLDGLKFRAYGPWCEVLTTFGVSVVTLSGDELYSAMERGIVDAFEYGTPTLNWTMGYQEVSEYIGIPGIHSPNAGGSMFSVAIDKWNELPDDIKAIIVAADESSTLRNYLHSVNEDAAAFKRFKDYGLETYTLSDELQKEFTVRAKAACEKHSAEDPLYKEVFENQKAFFKAFHEMYTSLPKYTIFG
jgi:TRAP-type mannitol/chloroaromatic compound transport system substrate-binding protein